MPVRLPPVRAQMGGPEIESGRWPPPDAAGRGPMFESNPAPRRSVKLVGSVLLVDGRPMFPRVIQHRGEPLGMLKKLGFNTVWLQRLPTPELLDEADRLGLWLICPPPRALGPIAAIGPAFDAVLAWDLGSRLDAVRSRNRRSVGPNRCGRRTGAGPAAGVLPTHRLTRLQPAGRPSADRPAAAGHQFADERLRGVGSSAAVAGQAGHARLDHRADAAQRGVAAAACRLGARVPPPLGVPPEQIRLLAYTAVAAGSRGLLLLSDTPLDAPDADTQQRATALELLNLELELIEPWAAAGSFVATSESSVPEVVGSVLSTERARLLLPIWSAPMAQCVPSQSAANSVAAGRARRAGGYRSL